jgi:hypothetical protein
MSRAGGYPEGPGDRDPAGRATAATGTECADERVVASPKH